MDLPEDIKALYQKYLDKTASGEELNRFFDWLRLEGNADLLTDEMESRWNDPETGSRYPGDWPALKARLRSAAAARQRRIYRPLRYAAAAAILLLVTITVWRFAAVEGTRVYTTPFGETRTVALPDGSQVLLNANSKMTWDRDWKKTGKRQVVLEGEAFFEVSHLSASSGGDYPFEVLTDDLKVRVLGTSFNVNSRRNETGVYLESGKVELAFSDQDRKNEEMLPGEFVSYSRISGAFVKQESSLLESASWKAGSFIYESAGLAKVIRDIEDIYGKEIIVEDPAILQRSVTVGLPYADWDVVVESLELILDLEIEKQKNGIIIKK